MLLSSLETQYMLHQNWLYKGYVFLNKWFQKEYVFMKKWFHKVTSILSPVPHFIWKCPPPSHQITSYYGTTKNFHCMKFVWFWGPKQFWLMMFFGILWIYQFRGSYQVYLLEDWLTMKICFITTLTLQQLSSQLLKFDFCTIGKRFFSIHFCYMTIMWICLLHIKDANISGSKYFIQYSISWQTWITLNTSQWSVTYRIPWQLPHILLQQNSNWVPRTKGSLLKTNRITLIITSAIEAIDNIITNPFMLLSETPSNTLQNPLKKKHVFQPFLMSELCQNVWC